jgi:hypothetical protein
MNNSKKKLKTIVIRIYVCVLWLTKCLYSYRKLFFCDLGLPEKNGLLTGDLVVISHVENILLRTKKKINYHPSEYMNHVPDDIRFQTKF